MAYWDAQNRDKRAQANAVVENAQIEQVVRSLYDDVWTGRRYELGEDLFHPDFSYAGAPDLRGPEAKLGAIRGYHETFPDLRVTIDDLVTSTDRAVTRYTFSGTDVGGLHGRPPTGRHVSVWGLDMFGFRDGRIISDWVAVDVLGLLVHGAIPDPWSS